MKLCKARPKARIIYEVDYNDADFMSFVSCLKYYHIKDGTIYYQFGVMEGDVEVKNGDYLVVVGGEAGDDVYPLTRERFNDEYKIEHDWVVVQSQI